MVAINGTSTGYLGSSGAPSIDTVKWASLQNAFGERYWVESVSAARVTVVSGTTVRVAAGRIGGWGVVDTFTGTRDLTLPTPSSDGTVHYLVATRRTWQTAQASTIEYVTGTSTRAIPAGRNANPGTIDDHPLALVAVTKSGATVTASVTDDLRVIGGHGNYEASSELVLTTTGYMQEPGYRIRIAGNQWTRLMDGTWDKVTPVEQSSSFGTSEGGWSVAGSQRPSLIVRDGRRREMYLEQRRTVAGIAAGGSGHVSNVTTFTLADGDHPVAPQVLSGMYYSTSNGDFPATGYLDTDGRVILTTLAPSTDLQGFVGAGGWSVRFSADWYTA